MFLVRLELPFPLLSMLDHGNTFTTTNQLDDASNIQLPSDREFFPKDWVAAAVFNATIKVQVKRHHDPRDSAMARNL